MEKENINNNEEISRRDAEPENEEKLPPTAPVVIEDFDDGEEVSDIDNYMDAENIKAGENEDEYKNESDGEDENIAAVAEALTASSNGGRITGERHSVVTTAAPIRIRDDGLQTRPAPTSMPVRRMNPSTEQNNVTEKRENQQGKKSKKKKTVLRQIIIAAAILVMILSGVITAVTLAGKDKNPPDIVGTEMKIPAETEISGDNTPETMENAEALENSAEDEPAAPDNGNDEGIPTETEVEAEPETEAPAPPPPPQYTVTLSFYDREDITVTVEQMTLAEVYEYAGYTPRDTDRPSLPPESVIASDSVIQIDTAEYKSETVSEVIPYSSNVIQLDTIPRGTTNYITYGENGQADRIYTVEYINGKETNRWLESENVVKYAVAEEYELGVGGSFVGNDGNTYTYSYRRTVPATYYSIEGLTYLGTHADETVVAVDSNNIPLGTRIYVKNDRYDFGPRIASDIGPKVEEWEVDIWISPSNPQLPAFATEGYVYDMEIYYID